jgi:hypothetical protein
MKLFGYHGIFFKKALCYDNEIPGGVGNLIFEMSRLFWRKDSVEYRGLQIRRKTQKKFTSIL